MAIGPDPNRHFETDPELTGEEQREGAGFGNPSSLRMGLPSLVSALLAVLVVVAFIFLLF